MAVETSWSPLRVIEGGRAPAEPPTPARDAALVQAVRAGAARAATQFHDRLRPIVDRTLARLLGARDPDYDDLAQQALIELVLSVDRFRGDCPLDAWASIVSARVVYRHIRRRRTERRLFVGGDDAETVESSDDRGAKSLLLRSTIRRIEAHLDGIDSKKAWTFVLHDVHGYDLNEVSTITGASKTATQSRLSRGRKELHQRIAKDPELAGMLHELTAAKREDA